jgi:hypothetical protein
VIQGGSKVKWFKSVKNVTRIVKSGEKWGKFAQSWRKDAQNETLFV